MIVRFNAGRGEGILMQLWGLEKIKACEKKIV